MSDSLVHSRQKCRALSRFCLRLLSQPSADSESLVPSRRYQRSIKSFSLFLNEAQFRQATSHPQTQIRHPPLPNAIYYTIFRSRLQSPSAKNFLLPRQSYQIGKKIHRGSFYLPSFHFVLTPFAEKPPRLSHPYINRIEKSEDLSKVRNAMCLC